jgi:G8 domain
VKRLSRRHFLILAGAAAASGALAAVRSLAWPKGGARPLSAESTTTTVSQNEAAVATSAPAVSGNLWSDPASWSNGVPGPDQVAVVTKAVVLDRDVQVAGVVVKRGGKLTFDPTTSRRLESVGNVVIEGRLAMRPASAAVQHRLVLTGARESKFAGGGMDVLDSDVGLWVMGSGVLELAGAPKLAWTRVTGAVAAGATTITLGADPAGWRPGDEIVLTPTLGPKEPGHALAFDTAQIRAIKGRTITLDRPTRFAHPTIATGSGHLQAAEVMNLTRNVEVLGTREGRAHVFVRSNQPQSLRSAVIQHMGPRQRTDAADLSMATASVKGRYGLHFHMCQHGSRGSVVESVVVRNTGSHAFVAHESHEITFLNCMAFDVLEDAYWWDGPPGTSTGPVRDPGSVSDKIVYDRCVAALVRWEPDYAGFTLAGFRMGRGTGNVCRDCVAVGVQGSKNSSGYSWGENEDGPGIWDFRRNVAHNNVAHGIFWWQVTASHHTVYDFLSYRNGGSGILNGAYGDNNHFERCTLLENGETQFFGWAGSSQHDPTDPNSRGLATPQHLVDSVMDSAGMTDFACILAGRSIVGDRLSVGQVTGNVFKGARKACVAVTYDYHDFGPLLTRWRLDRNRYDGNQFWFDDSSHEGAFADTEFGMLRRADQPGGSFNAAWNAKVS